MTYKNILITIFLFCSLILTDMLVKIPKNRLTKQKMMTVKDIVHSDLFLYPECRQILLPIILSQVKELFETSEEVKMYFIF